MKGGYLHTTSDQHHAIVTWMEDPKNFAMLVGNSDELTGGGVAVRNGKKMDAYRALADYVNSAVPGSNWDSITTKNRFESFSKMYKNAKTERKKEGFGITQEDLRKGILSVPAKLERLCPYYHRIEALFTGTRADGTMVEDGINPDVQQQQQQQPIQQPIIQQQQPIIQQPIQQPIIIQQQQQEVAAQLQRQRKRKHPDSPLASNALTTSSPSSFAASSAPASAVTSRDASSLIGLLEALRDKIAQEIQLKKEILELEKQEAEKRKLDLAKELEELEKNKQMEQQRLKGMMMTCLLAVGKSQDELDKYISMAGF